MHKKIIIFLLLFLFFAGNIWAGMKPFLKYKTNNSKTGFMVLAPDRGFLGNAETLSVFEKFKKGYLAEIVFVGRKYDGLTSNYSVYIQQALTALNLKSVSNIVVIPLFISKHNHILQTVKNNIHKYEFKGNIYWNETMSESYLTAQILMDLVNKISQKPNHEKLLILGRGAIDKKSEKLINDELIGLSNYIAKRKSFKTIKTGVYYSYNAPEKIRTLQDNEVDEMVIHTAATRGNTLVVPFSIGPKYSNMMSFTHFFERRFKDINITFNSDEILLHKNALLWMIKAANKYLPLSGNEKIGVVIMPHGATKPYNDAIEKTIVPLREKFAVEMAYGMGDAITIQNAVSKLESQGIKKIIFIRMYPTSEQLKEKTDYILGLSNKIPEQWDGLIPPQIKTSAVIKTFGGYEDDKLIADIFLDRIKEASEKPEEETIILLSHGSDNDTAENIRNNKMNNYIESIQNFFNPPFKKIINKSLREDWPEKRKKAVNEIKDIIEVANKEGGKVIIISNRLYGSGPYKYFLKGLNFKLNSKGLAPHPNLTKWLSKGIELVIKNEFVNQNKTDVTHLIPTPPPKASLVSN